MWDCTIRSRLVPPFARCVPRRSAPQPAAHLQMARLPRIIQMDGSSAGNGFYLCARKERRTGRGGLFLVLGLQDASGEIDAKVFQDVDTADSQFEAGEFVAV